LGQRYREGIGVRNFGCRAERGRGYSTPHVIFGKAGTHQKFLVKKREKGKTKSYVCICPRLGIEFLEKELE
jgi:hypothetical protein